MAHELNNTSHKIDPCGTQNFEHKRFEQCESISTKWLLFNK